MSKKFEKNLDNALANIKKDLMKLDTKNVKDIDVNFNIGHEEYHGEPIIYTISLNKYSFNKEVEE